MAPQLRSSSTRRRARAAAVATFLAAAATVVTIGTSPVAHATGPTLTAPLRVYTMVSTNIAFTGTDAISDENRAITTSVTANGCSPSDANDWALTGCARVQMDLSSATNGKLVLQNPSIHNYTYNGSPHSVVKVPSGAVVDQSTDGVGGPSQVIHIGGTPQQIQDTLDTLEYHPTPGYFDNADQSPITNLHIVLVDGTTSNNTSADVGIRVLHGNGSPDLTVPSDPLTAPKGTSTSYPDLSQDPAAPPMVTVVDPEMCNLTKCGAPYTNPGEATSVDQMLLVVWLEDQANCGTFALRGGAFTDQGGAQHDTIDKLLTDNTAADLEPLQAAAIENAIGLQASTVNLQSQPSSVTSNSKVFGLIGSIDNVRYALSSITYNAPNPAQNTTCDLNVAVSDMGSTGLPPQHGWKAAQGQTPAYEIPDAKADVQVVHFAVTDGHPDVTVEQAGPQTPGVDPTNQPLEYTVTFSEKVQHLTQADLTITGGGSPSVDIQPVGAATTYSVVITPSTDGMVQLSIAADKVPSAAGPTDSSDPNYPNYLNKASTSQDNSITYDTQAPAASIAAAGGQADPATIQPILFTVSFPEDVQIAELGSGDISFAGSTAGGSLSAVVTPVDAQHATVAVTGMTTDGNVTVAVSAGAVHDLAGNTSTASGTATVQWTSGVVDNTAPTVTINQAAGQADATSSSPILFTAVFSEPVTGFATGDVTLTGTAGATTAVVSGGPTTYTVSVSGMTTTGTVVADIPAGVAVDFAANPNNASTSSDNTVTFNQPALPALTATINQAGGQPDPTSGSSILFTAVFSNPVSDFATGDVTLTGTAGATTAVVSGGPTTFTVTVTGMTQTGTVIASIPAGVAHDAANQVNASSTSADHTVTWNAPTGPTVTINQSVGQMDPTTTSPITFTVVFSSPVTGFTGADVTLGGTAGATTANVSGGPSTYTVSVSGMTQTGTVIPSILPNKALDASNHGNQASTSTDHTVQYNKPLVFGPTVTVNQKVGQADPALDTPVLFTATFSAPVTGFDGSDVQLTGTAGATTAVVSGGPTVYTVTVSGMTSNGSIVATIPQNVAQDGSNAVNFASTSSDNQVSYQPAQPSVTVEQAAGQASSTSDPSVQFTATFSLPVTGFDGTDVTVGGTAGATSATVSGGPSTYTITVSGMTASGTVTASIPAGKAVTAANKSNLQSTSADNTVDWVAPTTISTPGGSVSLGVSSGGTLTTFTTGAPSVTPPAGYDLPYGQLSFSATTPDNGYVTFTLVLPSAPSDYLKLVGGTWQSFTWDGTTGAQINGTTVTITIQDNGRGDSDPTLGVATDPGMPVYSIPPTTSTTTVTTTPATTTPATTGPATTTPSTGSTTPTSSPTTHGGTGAGLPATGADTTSPIEIGAWCVAIGAALFLAGRRRHLSRSAR